MDVILLEDIIKVGNSYYVITAEKLVDWED